MSQLSRHRVFYEESANRTPYIVDGGPEKTLQTDAVMTAHAMRDKPFCRPCLFIEISQVSVNKRA